MRTFFKAAFSCLLLFALLPAQAQIREGKIVYERKTNIYKKFPGEDIKRWIQETEKTKVDAFELYFNDSISYFGPEETDLKEAHSWATQKNKVYQNFKTGRVYSIKEFWEEDMHMTDSVKQRTWKIVPGKRNIAGFECHKALWQANDSLRIYAWYTNQISVSVGPESFTGLPGAILGLATEDGGVIYFARQVIPGTQDLAMLEPKKYRGKVYTAAELREMLEKEYGKESWGKTILRDIFYIW
jgi:GLPGLI family protein